MESLARLLLTSYVPQRASDTVPPFVRRHVPRGVDGARAAHRAARHAGWERLLGYYPPPWLAPPCFPSRRPCCSCSRRSCSRRSRHRQRGRRPQTTPPRRLTFRWPPRTTTWATTSRPFVSSRSPTSSAIVPSSTTTCPSATSSWGTSPRRRTRCRTSSTRSPTSPTAPRSRRAWRRFASVRPGAPLRPHRQLRARPARRRALHEHRVRRRVRARCERPLPLPRRPRSRRAVPHRRRVPDHDDVQRHRDDVPALDLRRVVRASAAAAAVRRSTDATRVARPTVCETSLPGRRPSPVRPRSFESAAGA